MIITLAGHVDHGKTTLVRELTGVDTDRLAQEKARGLTIELGFAYTDQLGFVDVPGHQKFIHNMVAGVAAQQHALMVIAADDGPMPQSREHLDILSLLGVKQGTVVLTKCDLVPPERLQACHAEIASLTEHSFLRDAEVFQTSAAEPAGYQALSDHLQEVANTHRPDANTADFRLAIDRVFTVKGAGVVVTGTVHCGTIAVDQSVSHFPSNKTLRVRSMRVQDKPADQATVGDRCALNLVGTSLEELKRGDWLTHSAGSGCQSITIKLDKASGFPRAVKHWMPVHIYHATSHCTGRLALFTHTYDEGTWAEIICDEPMACHRGDRIVLRDHDLDSTIGGGEVLYTQQRQVRRRNSETHRALVSAYAAPSPTESFKQLMALSALKPKEFKDIWNLPEISMDALKADHTLKVIGDIAVSEAQWQQLMDKCLAQISQTTDESNDLTSAGLRAKSLQQVPSALRQPLLDALLKNRQIEQSGGFYSLPDKEPTLPSELASLWARVQPLLDHAQAPSCGDLAKTLEVPLTVLEKNLLTLSKRKLLVHIGSHRFYLPSRLSEIAMVVEKMTAKSASASMTVKAFRDETGIGRNVAIDVLEYFDSKGFTRRQGNERVIVRPFSDL